MATLSPKQQEIRDRESRILDHARPMVLSDGVLGLSMDLIAKEMRYAKGTIYNHFSCKEEILLAMAIQSTETRLALFHAGKESQERSRDKMAAIGIACEDFRVRFDDLFQIEMLVRNSVVMAKGSKERLDLLTDCEGRCMELVASIGHEAIARDDLKLERTRSVEDVIFGLWSITYGGMLIDASSPGLSNIGIEKPLDAILRNCNSFMDGLDWRPLYDASEFRRLKRSVTKKLHKQVPQLVNRDGCPS